LALSRKIGRASRRSRKPASRWIIARQIVQYLALAAFVLLFINARRDGWPASITGPVVRLDPLLTLAHLLASRTFLWTSAIALLTLLLTLVFGRAWCGWLCPLGTVLDLLPLHRLRRSSSAVPSLPEKWRAIKYILLLAILTAALFGNLTLLVFDPMTLLFRTLTLAVWPALEHGVTLLETALYPLPILGRLVEPFDAWVRPQIIAAQPVRYQAGLVFALFFAAVVGLGWFAPRFWCRYLCPLGGLLGWISRAALFQRRVSLEDCKGCSLCERACPTGTIDPERGFASDPAECTLCLECLPACPRSSVTFSPRLSLAPWREYDPGRRQALAAFGLTLAALAVLRSDAWQEREPDFLLRPPGARENDFLAKCVRCAECMRTCPTGAIQPWLAETGAQGVWTPVIIPRLGYCDYSCNACGTVCPVQAIPSLTLEEKRTQVIGKAYIDQDRCIAWSDHSGCIVCEEMCPLPEKAIWLEEVEFSTLEGDPLLVQVPHVDRERCIGCGICEYKCPVNGHAAIRVFVPGMDTPL
jgi:polyferredoxin